MAAICSTDRELAVGYLVFASCLSVFGGKKKMIGTKNGGQDVRWVTRRAVTGGGGRHATNWATNDRRPEATGRAQDIWHGGAYRPGRAPLYSKLGLPHLIRHNTSSFWT
eukprot:scaffold36735_cov65-Cyclotella_meneghiniana.AAC.1